MVPADDQADRVALHVRDQDFCVVERRVHMRNTCGDVLETFFLGAFVSRAIDQSLPYFFLPAMAFAGPLRVRALVWVR